MLIKLLRALALAFVLFLTGCDTHSRNWLLVNEYIHSKAEVGSITKLSSLGIDDAETVCFLQPYRTAVYDKHPDALKINEYLHKIGYMSDEGDWALIITRKEEIELLKFQVSKNADVASAYLIKYLSLPPPDIFEMTGCVPYEQAALFKTMLDGRIYFAFGRKK